MSLVDLATEREHLVRADRNIADGDARVRRQIELIQRLAPNGVYGLAEAKTLLRTLQDTLAAWRVHRENILNAIARLETGETVPSPASMASAAEPTKP